MIRKKIEISKYMRHNNLVFIFYRSQNKFQSYYYLKKKICKRMNICTLCTTSCYIKKINRFHWNWIHLKIPIPISFFFFFYLVILKNTEFLKFIPPKIQIRLNFLFKTTFQQQQKIKEYIALLYSKLKINQSR